MDENKSKSAELSEVKIELAPVPEDLSPNKTPSRWVKASAVKAYRIAAWARTLKTIGRKRAPKWETATGHAVFFFAVKRRRDKDNLAASLKAAWDGITDAGIMANDSGLTPMPVEIVVGPTERPRVEITITEGGHA